MPHFIAHRVNKLADLLKQPHEYGVEIDIRPYGTELVLEHDPYLEGEALEPYLKNYQHGTLILNCKAEGVELRILELLKKYKIENYFFLDSSFPFINKLASLGERRLALRFSEYEGMDTLRTMQGRVQWVWVDCFTRFPLDVETYQEIKALGYKICIVSPELQGQEAKIDQYRQFMANNAINVDAICTKLWNIPRWQ